MAIVSDICMKLTILNTCHNLAASINGTFIIKIVINKKLIFITLT